MNTPLNPPLLTDNTKKPLLLKSCENPRGWELADVLEALNEEIQALSYNKALQSMGGGVNSLARHKIATNFMKVNEDVSHMLAVCAGLQKMAIEYAKENGCETVELSYDVKKQEV